MATQQQQPKGPYRLVTVNTAPDRAKKLIGRVVEDMKDQYTIQHVANCESMSLCFFWSSFYLCHVFRHAAVDEHLIWQGCGGGGFWGMRYDSDVRHTTFRCRGTKTRREDGKGWNS